ncbi:hypothetical protein HMI54_009651 [Coelomomyces lativittatus]|nr:hypothetical protein HMI54_009651 [Coelomomyces lativittatus]
MHERLLSVPLLVIDEFIVFNNKLDWYFESVIRERVNSKLSTVITTNLGPSEIKKKLPALAAVMVEAILPIEIAGHDFRGSKGDDLKDDITKK